MRRSSRRGSFLAVLFYVVAAGVLTQAVLAGFFLSGVAGGARTAHIVVGWLLPYFALVPAVVAFRLRSREGASRGVVIGGAILPVVLWIQEVLGAVPAAATTVIHVPLGVALFAVALLLGLASSRTSARETVSDRPSEHAVGSEESASESRKRNVSTMSSNNSSRTTNPGVRLVVLVIAALVITNAVAAALFERDTALGFDELLVAVVGVGLALVLEFVVFRRGRR